MNEKKFKKPVGEDIWILGILGNGFSKEEGKGKKVLFMGLIPRKQ